jgi:hypothetical protein
MLYRERQEGQVLSDVTDGRLLLGPVQALEGVPVREQHLQGSLFLQ